MTPERWQRMRRVLEAAVALSPAQREAFLQTAVTEDPGLRAEATLTGASMESVLEKIQTEPAARQHVESRCTPPLQALVEP